MNDLQLKQAVIDELEFDPAIEAAHVTAFVHDGVVTLTGYVTDYAQKHAAEQAVRRIKGVKAVAQNLDVRLPGDKQIADDEIAARASRILEWDQRLPRGTIAVMVEDGVVTLTGLVPWNYQRRGAEADVRKLSGVVTVSNQIAVSNPIAPRPDTDLRQVQAKIRAAFERAADLEADNISVRQNEDGAVVLGGHVHTMLERAAAENAAWSAPGVNKVINQIEIGY